MKHEMYNKRWELVTENHAILMQMCRQLHRGDIDLEEVIEHIRKMRNYDFDLLDIISDLELAKEESSMKIQIPTFLTKAKESC